MSVEIEIFRGDINTLKVDAVVHPINVSSIYQGGLDAMVYKANRGNSDKRVINKLSRNYKGCLVGYTIIAPTNNTTINYTLYTVCPIWQGGSQNESNKLC